MEKFIEQNGLVKRRGLDEWYSADNKTRLVKIGDRYRMDIKRGIKRDTWSTFYSYYVVGPRSQLGRVAGSSTGSVSGFETARV